MTKRLPVSACVVAAAVVLFLWDQLFAGQTFYLRDVICDALPWRRFAAQELAGGSIPLWNPHSRFGQPFLANPQSAVLYPPHLLFVVLPIGWAFKLNMLGHLLLGGVSMAALLQRFRLHHVAAAFGGIVWALGGYMTANLEFMSVMETLAWCPLTVLLTVRLAEVPAERRTQRAYVTRGAALAAVIAVQFLAGQAQPLAFSVLIAGAFMAVAARTGETPWWTLGTSDERRRARNAGLALGAAVVVAAGLTAIQWMPTRELLPLSIRADVDPGLKIASAHPRHLLHLLAPFASGHPGASTWRGGTLFEFWLGSIYIGLLPLLLVPAAFTLRRVDGPAARLPVACGFVAVIGLLLALGQHTPLYGWLLDTVPGFDLFRWPAKAFQLVVFALTVLSAAGLHAVLQSRDTASRARIDTTTVAAAAIAAATVLLIVLRVEGGTRGAVFGVIAAAVALALRIRRVPVRAALAAALLLVVADLYSVSRQIHLVDDDAILEAVPTGVPDVGEGRVHTEYTFAQFALYGSRDASDYADAIDLLAGDTGLSLGLDRTYGGDALQVARARELWEMLFTMPRPARAKLGHALGVEAWLDGPEFNAIRRGSGAARWSVENDGFQRAYTVGDWSADASLIAPRFDARRSAVVGTAGVPRGPGGPPGAQVAGAHFSRETVEVDVDVSRRALLVVADTHFPGWVARVDGAPREILQVNEIFRGVLLEPGDREVRMTYEPRSFRSGVTWSAFSALALCALLLAVLLPRRRRSPGSATAG